MLRSHLRDHENAALKYISRNIRIPILENMLAKSSFTIDVLHKCHNAWDRYPRMSAHFCYKMLHCGISVSCIVAFDKWFCCAVIAILAQCDGWQYLYIIVIIIYIYIYKLIQYFDVRIYPIRIRHQQFYRTSSFLFFIIFYHPLNKYMQNTYNNQTCYKPLPNWMYDLLTYRNNM